MPSPTIDYGNPLNKKTEIYNSSVSRYALRSEKIAADLKFNRFNNK